MNVCLLLAKTVEFVRTFKETTFVIVDIKESILGNTVKQVYWKVDIAFFFIFRLNFMYTINIVSFVHHTNEVCFPFKSSTNVYYQPHV